MLPECLGNIIKMLQQYCYYLIITTTTAATAAERQVRPKYIFNKINITISNNAFLLYYPFSTLSDLLLTKNHSSILNKYLAKHQAKR